MHKCVNLLDLETYCNMGVNLQIRPRPALAYQSRFLLFEKMSEVDNVLRAKKIWPFPTAADGKESGWEERASIAKKEKYQLWQSSKISEIGQTWKLLNGIDPTTGSSDASTSETSESEAPDEDEEEDEV